MEGLAPGSSCRKDPPPAVGRLAGEASGRRGEYGRRGPRVAQGGCAGLRPGPGERRGEVRVEAPQVATPWLGGDGRGGAPARGPGEGQLRGEAGRARLEVPGGEEPVSGSGARGPGRRDDDNPHGGDIARRPSAPRRESSGRGPGSRGGKRRRGGRPSGSVGSEGTVLSAANAQCRTGGSPPALGRCKVVRHAEKSRPCGGRRG